MIRLRLSLRNETISTGLGEKISTEGEFRQPEGRSRVKEVTRREEPWPGRAGAASRVQRLSCRHTFTAAVPESTTKILLNEYDAAAPHADSERGSPGTHPLYGTPASAPAPQEGPDCTGVAPCAPAIRTTGATPGVSGKAWVCTVRAPRVTLRLTRRRSGRLGSSH